MTQTYIAKESTTISAESVRVTICGQEYFIHADVDRDTTRKIAEFVNRKIAEIRRENPLRDSLKIAVLSALNIAGELYELNQKYETITKQLVELQQKVASLNDRLENSIKTATVV
ncbi:MAG: cell division protein ZapA [Chitinivibrionales bacterium]|nr:cell division protein ZapA [Chitinivibrionales bacterium]